MSVFNRAEANTAAADRADRLEELARVVDLGLRNFARSGSALAEIRDKQLYRVSHQTFEAFALARWKMTARHAERLIEAAAVCDQLVGFSVQPANEHQARQIAQVPTEQRPDAWREAVAAADGAQPGPAQIAAAVALRTRRKKRRPRPLRVRVPGGSVVIERNRLDAAPEAMLRAALAKLATTEEARAA